jgi:hypothetical protein
MATTIRAVRTGTIRSCPSHRATDMSKLRWRRRLAMILDRDWISDALVLVDQVQDWTQGHKGESATAARARSTTRVRARQGERAADDARAANEVLAARRSLSAFPKEASDRSRLWPMPSAISPIAVLARPAAPSGEPRMRALSSVTGCSSVESLFDRHLSSNCRQLGARFRDSSHGICKVPSQTSGAKGVRTPDPHTARTRRNV